MTVGLVSTYHNRGGAAIAAKRLLDGLEMAGVPCWMMTARGGGAHPAIKGPNSASGRLYSRAGPFLDKLWPLKLYPGRTTNEFSPALLMTGTRRRVEKLHSDVVHLHWVSDGFLPITAVPRFRSPVVWTLHDMWNITGGCHYTMGCERFLDGCGKCPQLGSMNDRDLSWFVWHRKRNYWGTMACTYVSPSRWLAAEAKRSPILSEARVEVIPNGLDLSVFHPIDRREARRILRWPERAFMVLFGASGGTRDPRKGFQLLSRALEGMQTRSTECECALAVFGQSGESELANGRHPVYDLGTVHDEKTLCLAYSAADVFVAPSLQDNLPNTVVEALACGTPGVGFSVGGLPEIVKHRETGFLAKEGSVESLREGILWAQGVKDSPSIREACRETAERDFDLKLSAKRHLNLYEEIIEMARNSCGKR
ncbi:MAG: glycosyltransferase family 4 protein [Acidobacteria bacterium]|nr:glycosyltransferase family 4 protein [Acidobacteriota bacterium]